VEPDFAPASFYLGACYAAVAQDREATTAWRRALLGPVKTPVVYTVLADGLFRLGDPPQAIAPLREAFTTWPDDDQIRRRLAIAYAVTLQDANALIAVAPYLTRHPEDHDALLVALHAIYALQVSDAPPLADGEALRQMTQYADAYVAAGGPHVAIVTSWLEALRKP
jgi:predicted Zn-dependent protease